MDRRGLSPRSHDRRPDPHRWVPNQFRRNQLYEGSETLGIHVSGFGDEVVIGVIGHEIEIVKLAMALMPVSLLLCGSVVLFRLLTRSGYPFSCLDQCF
jgi:hypothetical protein